MCVCVLFFISTWRFGFISGRMARHYRRTLEQSREGGRTYASNAFIQSSCNRLVTSPPTPSHLSHCVLGALFVLSLVIFASPCLNGTCHVAGRGKNGIQRQKILTFFFLLFFPSPPPSAALFHSGATTALQH